MYKNAFVVEYYTKLCDIALMTDTKRRLKQAVVKIGADEVKHFLLMERLSPTAARELVNGDYDHEPKSLKEKIERALTKIAERLADQKAS